jgi:cation:H+ antiporter
MALAYAIAGFAGCALIILWAGRHLSFYGDLLAVRTGWGKAWVGLILMASVTSLPELMVGISSAAIVQSADLAVGDILGSCAFNLGLLAMLDAFVPKHRAILSMASRNHVLAAALGIILLGMVGIGLFLPREIVITSWIGLSSIAFIAIYLVSIRIIYLFEKKNALVPAVQEAEAEVPEKKLTTRQVVVRYILFALVIVCTALALPYFADSIAEATGLGKSFVGTLFLAISTSLPEIAVSYAAIRMGAIDMAVGNLLGSNIFNILILAIDDLVYTRGFLLKDASRLNMLSVFSVILMSAVVIIGLSYRAEGKRYKLAWDAAVIFLIYVVNIVLLYQLQ